MTKAPKRKTREQLEFERKRLDEAYVIDLRDDTISLILGDRTGEGSAYAAFSRVQESGGPTIKTLESWHQKRVLRPQAPTLRAALRAVGYDLGIIPGSYRRIS